MKNIIINLIKNKTYNLKAKLTPSFILFFFSIILLNTYLIYSINLKDTKKQDIYRLHVVANSNSVDDQITKLKVETKVKDYLDSLHYDETSDIYKILEDNVDNILDITNKELKDKDYSGTLDIGKIYYDEKESIEYSMASGTYNSARIVLGKGEGQNIWSIIFPNKDTVKSIEELDTIFPGIKSIYTEDKEIDSPKYQYDFKILELIRAIEKHLKS